ncbi:hypothetical protein SAMN05216368_10578 [Cryobacterium flavum]|uniref:Exo-alpha-sialidase n=1 Tax=Cryobacterium flavum TaxID=1424659 RepID=A0A4R8V458_9MICO|nr:MULTISPECIES: hypothetical protein [Cryobacterium]TFB77158.1 hypothetical protein E3O21_09695 [Cryobacterium flavum]SDN37647.1 hypothetical protein SAMN05216368_10578 [Cryobacterium flavum]
MRRFHRTSPRDSSRRRLWVYLAVGLFLLADIYLVATALTSTRAETSLPDSPPPAALVPTATPVPSPTGSVAASVSPVPLTRILSAVSSTIAWRAVTGTCPDPLAEPAVSTDGGASWTATDANGPTEVTALQSIDATNESVAQFVGFAEEDCSPQVVRTFVAGDNYSSSEDELDTMWFVDPADRSELHGPAGFQPAPCDAVVSLAPSSDADSAAVLCADGRLFATTDAATTWSPPVTVAGIVTVTATSTGYLAVATTTGTTTATDCIGVNLVALTADLTPTVTGCYPTEQTPAALAGNVAVAAADDTLWLWIGDATLRSTDAGRTWL